VDKADVAPITDRELETLETSGQELMDHCARLMKEGKVVGANGAAGAAAGYHRGASGQIGPVRDWHPLGESTLCRGYRQAGRGLRRTQCRDQLLDGDVDGDVADGRYLGLIGSHPKRSWFSWRNSPQCWRYSSSPSERISLAKIG